MHKSCLMEVVVVVVVRPKWSVGSIANQSFNSKLYDIMLVENRLAYGEKNKSMKSLLKISLNIREEPREAILAYIYEITGAELGGIKGVRVLPIHLEKHKLPAGHMEAFSKMHLFCVPVSHRDKLNKLVEKSTSSPVFFSLDVLLDTVNHDSFTLPANMYPALSLLESWLREKHLQPKGIECMFRTGAEYRIAMSINNPAFIPRIDRGSENTDAHLDGQVTTFVALTKLLALEKCDIVVMNPLFGSGLPYKPKSNTVVSNIYWGLGVPDYGKAIAYHQSVAMESKRDRDQLWANRYPVHVCAYEGDIVGIRDRLAQGFSSSSKDTASCAPIHYAAWKGHVDAVMILLEAGCSPNITNGNFQTPLHIAAVYGQLQIVHLLLEHGDIQVDPVDKNGMIPYALCIGVNKHEWQRAASLLRVAMNRPSRKIEVHLMDGDLKKLNLVAGDNTTVHQLKEQMLRDLELTQSYENIFTIWICSQSLELQLKPEHKPVHQLHEWKRVVNMLTDADSSKEKPILRWRRNARVSLEEESRVQHSVAINLLFHEAYYNYVNALYPCVEQDVILLASILLYMSCGECDMNTVRAHLSNSKNIQKLVPAPKLRSRGSNWNNKIQNQYRQFTTFMASSNNRSPQVLKLHFLSLCRNLSVYGSAFFSGALQERASRHTPCHIGVNDVGIHLISFQTKAMIQSRKYADIVWQHRSEYPDLLEIHLRNSNSSNSSRAVIQIRTKQAGLIVHLMGKLAELHSAQ